MTAEKAEKLCMIFRQVREVLKDSLDNLEVIAENAITIFVDDESDRKILSSSVAIERRLLNKKEVAERLGISIRTLNELQNEGLPVVQLRKRVLFDFEEVWAWIKEKDKKNNRKNRLRVVR